MTPLTKQSVSEIIGMTFTNPLYEPSVGSKEEYEEQLKDSNSMVSKNLNFLKMIDQELIFIQE